MYYLLYQYFVICSLLIVIWLGERFESSLDHNNSKRILNDSDFLASLCFFITPAFYPSVCPSIPQSIYLPITEWILPCLHHCFRYTFFASINLNDHRHPLYRHLDVHPVSLLIYAFGESVCSFLTSLLFLHLSIQSFFHLPFSPFIFLCLNPTSVFLSFYQASIYHQVCFVYVLVYSLFCDCFVHFNLMQFIPYCFCM